MELLPHDDLLLICSLLVLCSAYVFVYGTTYQGVVCGYTYNSLACTQIAVGVVILPYQYQHPMNSSTLWPCSAIPYIYPHRFCFQIQFSEEREFSDFSVIQVEKTGLKTLNSYSHSFRCEHFDRAGELHSAPLLSINKYELNISRWNRLQGADGVFC